MRRGFAVARCHAGCEHDLLCHRIITHVINAHVPPVRMAIHAAPPCGSMTSCWRLNSPPSTRYAPGLTGTSPTMPAVRLITPGLVKLGPVKEVCVAHYETQATCSFSGSSTVAIGSASRADVGDYKGRRVDCGLLEPGMALTRRAGGFTFGDSSGRRRACTEISEQSAFASKINCWSPAGAPRVLTGRGSEKPPITIESVVAGRMSAAKEMAEQALRSPSTSPRGVAAWCGQPAVRVWLAALG